MSLNFQGFVLRPPRIAPANAVTTGSATSGVVRDVKALPSSYDLPGPELVDAAASQYKSAILLPNGETEEYLVFAANTSNLTVLEGFAVENEATGRIVAGELEAFDNSIPTIRLDGSDKVVIVDDGNRSIKDVLSFQIERGDGGIVVLVQALGDFTYDPVSGVAVLSPAVLGQAQPLPGSGPLTGGASRLRGDKVLEIRHTLSAARYWWTKNGQGVTRFGYDGGKQRWVPLKGSTPFNLGELLEDGEYTLSPSPDVEIGNYLPGDSDNPDSYSMVRIGAVPDSTSIPVAEPVGVTGFGGILVIADEDQEEYDFGATPTAAGVIGRTEAKITWNPSFLEQFSGQTIWYSNRSFVEEQSGRLGSLLSSKQTPLFLAPIPECTDYPFIRIGSRNHLEALVVDTDNDLLSLTVNEGQVGVSLSTGQLKFSDADVAKADPDDQGFDKQFLGDPVIYDGLSMTQVPLAIREPVRLLDENGQPAVVGTASELYVPLAGPLPAPGVSGVLWAPDGTGDVPNTSTVPGIRPNGSGLERQLESVGDLILFTETGVFDRLDVEDTEDDLPRFEFKIRRGRAAVARENGAFGSRVKIGTKSRSEFSGEGIWLVQSEVTPSVYYSNARLFSRLRDNYVLEGDEVFKFAVNGNEYVWDASTDPGGIITSAGGTFSAADIATSLQAVMDAGASVGEAITVLGRVAIQTPKDALDEIHVGTIEIGYGPGTTTDLSGAAALGFVPGARLHITDPADLSNMNLVPDSGASIGVFRSPVNLARRNATPDTKNKARLEDEVLQEQVMAMPVILLDNPPLEDEAGYSEGVFFQLQDGLLIRFLQNFEQIYYQFDGDEEVAQSRISWADEFSGLSQVEQVLASVPMGRQLIIPETVHPSVGGGLRVSEDGGPLVLQTFDEDFLLPQNGVTGQATLIRRVAPFVIRGGNGTHTEGSTTFVDGTPGLDFQALGVTQGYKLKITSAGEAQGYYEVESVPAADTLEVSPAFPVDSVGTAAWELYEGTTDDEFDEGIVADNFYKQFNHLPAEPFVIKALDNLGQVPADAAAQEANRLKATVSDALISGRTIEIRFGLPTRSPTATLVALTKTELGSVANGLFVPDSFPPSERFTNNDFSIRVGTQNYTFGDGTLVKIADINDPVDADKVAVLDQGGLQGDGELKFGIQVLSDFASSPVVYRQEFSDPDNSPTTLPAYTTEFSPDTGEVNFSAVDMSEFAGFDVYFVEQMITEEAQDVRISPINGGFSFVKPMRTGQIVEASYFQATGGGDIKLDDETGLPIKIIEFLPVFVRLEDAEPFPPEASASNTWSFNPNSNTVNQTVEPQVFVNGELKGFLGNGSVIVNFDSNTFDLDDAVEKGIPVQISYAILEAEGGETAYTASTVPVYRPPFFLEAGQSTFTLDTDRTADLPAGHLLRLGPAPFYIEASSYDLDSDQTTVTVFPTPVVEAGSRSPGNDALSLVSVEPVTTAFNANAKDGFFLDLPVEYETIPRGETSVTFFGDVTKFAIAGHLLEVAGAPYLITDVEIIQDGRKTKVSVTTPFTREFTSGTDDFRISVRPIYQPNPRNFLGRGPIVSTEPFEVVLFGETDDSGNELPGRVLRLGPEYNVDFDTGNIDLVEPTQEPLQQGQTLFMRRTQLRILAPFIIDDTQINPRFSSGFSFVTTPDEESNGYLDKTLRATYTFSNPDSFYLRLVPLEAYLPEVASIAEEGVQATNPSQGPTVALAAAGGSSENYEQGTVGLEAVIQDLENQDRAARAFLAFYNATVVSFEQIIESIDGVVIGDRDGKFQFFVGKGLDFAPPGFEDPYSGELNERNIYAQIFLSITKHIVVNERDKIVDPATATLVGNEIEGDFPDPDTLREIIDDQKPLIKNDIDDRVIIGRTRTRAKIPPFFFPEIFAFGRFRRMGQAHAFSRLFPERAKAFTITNPGINADLENNEPGVYSRRKAVGTTGPLGIRKVRKRTTGKPIATVSNPVLEVIENIQSVQVGDRLPRARIWAYSRNGFADFDAVAGTSTAGKQALIATPLLLKDFPIDADTGFPDFVQFQSQGGDLPDLDSGDPDLFTPPFLPFDDADAPQQVAFGNPDGTVLDVGVNKVAAIAIPGFSGDVLKTIFIKEVQAGCVILFQDDQGSDITAADEIVVADEDNSGGDPIELTRGDTIFITPPDLEITTSDPPTTEELEQIAKVLPGYRVGFDVNVDRSDGELIDATYRSVNDPSLLAFKEWLGQKPPKPMRDLEMNVRFRNGRVDPVEFPALTGDNKDDDGDYSIPYLALGNTEIQRLNAVQPLVEQVLQGDTPEPGAEYPDEVLGDDGVILSVLSGGDPPAALSTSQDPTPVTTNGFYVPGSSVGDVRPFDFLLVETSQAGIPDASQGILSVGAVEGGSSGGIIEPPRFVTPTNKGGLMRYRFENAITFIRQGFQGLVLSRALTVTTFDGTAVGGNPFNFNDGSGISVGGLLNILDPGGALTYPGNGNVIRINLFRGDTGAFLQTVVVEPNNGFPQITGDAGTQSLNAIPDVFSQQMEFDTPAAFLTITDPPGPGEIPEDVGNPGFSIPLWFTIEIDTTDPTGGSLTSFIDDDRLTFSEDVDLRSVLDRSEPTLSGQQVHGQLRVTTVEGPTSSDITVNAPTEVNGGSDFTFKDRAASFPTIGTFSGGTGTIKVMGFEGHGNTAIDSTDDLTFSAMPSSAFQVDGLICSGTGFCESEDVISAPDANAYRDFDNRVAIPTVNSGDIDNIQKGDILVIKASGTAPATTATTKAGTYIVRHAIKENFPEYRALALVAEDKFAGPDTGFADIKFPSLVSSDVQGAGEIVISDASGPGATGSWAPSGRIYFIPNRSDITTTISIAYTAVDVNTGTFTVTPGTGLDHNGVVGPSDSDFDDLDVGTLVSGMVFIGVEFTKALDADPRLPSDHLVGHRGDGTFTFAAGGTAFGFRSFSLDNPVIGGPAILFNYDDVGGGGFTVVGAPGAADIGVTSAFAIVNGQFNSDEDPPVYPNTPQLIDLSELTPGAGGQWHTLHGGGVGVGEGVDCLFPNDRITTQFRAQAGIFLEPSVPRPVQNLDGPDFMVVDADNSLLGAGQLGFRSGQDFGILANPAPSGLGATPEEVTFEVRRVRRWHSVLDDISEQLGKLRFAYEIRRGTVDSFGLGAVPGGVWPYILESSGGTQLGPFDDADVNINPGDIVRLIDPVTGEVLDTAEVSGVLDGDNLLLMTPGFSKVDPGSIPGLTFEVFIKVPPVPHEQSNEELLELLIDEVIVERRADYTTQDGGFAPQPNVMQDKDGAGTINFVALGVQPGDIIIVDPAGQVEGPTGVPVTGPEFGARPFGDTATSNRTVYEAGRPSELDDNRGYYFVSSLIGSDGLEVTGKGEFAGDSGTDVLFGSTPETEYAVYPTVRFAGFEEGQADLRQTSYAGDNGSQTDSFKDNFLSIAPFSYRIIRPSQLFTREAQELILFMRERMLSWIEELGALARGTKSGSYFVFQQDTHVADLGNTSIPDDGLGVPSNALVGGILGLNGTSPFANVNDCLSILDRRYWILDLTLDTQKPKGAAPADPTYATFESNSGNPAVEAGEGRPVLPDLIDDVLTNNDRFRELRFSWIDFRVNLRNGTLATTERFLRELPARIRERQRLLRLDSSFKNV